MVVALLSLLIATLPTPDSTSSAADSTAAKPRVVHLFDEIVVRARMRDPLSSQSVRTIEGGALRRLPVDRLSEALALEPGVVARGEELHVRGGRAGELLVQLEGIPLNEPERDSGTELPMLALAGAELASGGLDARYGGALAGVLDLKTRNPGPRPGAEIMWQRSATMRSRYDRVGGRLESPIGHTGIGVAASGEATLDDADLPSLRSFGRRRILGESFGWRAENRMLGDLKLTAGNEPRRLALELVASREIHAPYDPMWSLDGWTTPCGDPSCLTGPAYSDTMLAGYERYRAADHLAMTDDRRIEAVLSAERITIDRRLGAAVGWAHRRAVTSVGGRDDDSYVLNGAGPLFGNENSRASDPFFVYGGDEPFFQRRASTSLFFRADAERFSPRGSRAAAGLGGSYDEVQLFDLDRWPRGSRLDSLRSYRAFAPGLYGYGQARWIFEGFVINGGMRAEYFTAGPQARAQSQSMERAARGVWSLSPRAGIAYPISVRDVFSASYTRVQQNPARDFLYDNRRKITNREPLGNPALTPATVISYQAAVKHLLTETWSLQAAYFYNDLFGLIGARNISPTLAIPTLRYENADAGHASGVEATLLRETAHTRLELGYTFMEAAGTLSREEGVPFGPRLAPRPQSIGEHPLDWDRRHSLTLSAHIEKPGEWLLSWTTQVGSGFPWTPRERRQLEADVRLENARRFKWDEWSSLTARWTPRAILPHVTLGLDVRNVFDFRTEASATADGYPNPIINTLYDDYAAYRTETGRGGGAYWDDRNGDGHPGWIPVNDPRLLRPPRTVRLSLGAAW